MKPSYIFFALCSAKSSIIFSKFKYKINLRVLCGVKLRIFKNY